MSDLEEELYKAVSSNEHERIIDVLRKGASANALVQSGQTILGHAVQIGNCKTIKILLDCEKYMPIDEPGNTSKSTFDDPSLDIDSYLKSTWFQWEHYDENMAFESTTNKSTTSQLERISPGSIASGGKSQEENCGLSHLSKPSNWELRLFRSLREFSTRKKNCDINLADFYDRMPIHYAAELGNPEILELLLQAECRVNVSDSKMLTPLHFSVGKGNEVVTEMLLKAGSRVNCKTSDKFSALHLAASRGYSKIVEQLLNYGAKIDILDSSDRTPLFLAVSRSHHNVTKILIDRGSKVNVEEIHGYTPLSEAVFQKDTDMVQLLLLAGAKVTTSHHMLHFSVYHRLIGLSQQLIATGLNINHRDDCGDTPLHIAVRLAQVDLVELLTKSGGDINSRNNVSGQSLIHEAVEGISESDINLFSTIMGLLLQKGCKLDVESFTPGDTPLYRAILLDKYRFAEELIKYGSDVNMGNVYSCDIDNLCLAKRKNHFRCVQLLVFAGFCLWNTPWLEILPHPGKSYPLTSIKGWLLHMKRNPLNLTDKCRIIIRRTVGPNLARKILSLTIPDRMKSYLLLEDLSRLPTDDVMKITDTSNANVLRLS